MKPAATVPGADEAAWPDDAVEIGRIVGAWGLQGWVRIQPFSADPQVLQSARIWWLGHRGPGAQPAGAGSARRIKVAQLREHGDGLVARLHDIDDRNAAEALRGLTIVVGRSAFPTPEADEYYWVDLIGCEVVNRQGERLGVVQELFATGPTSVMRLTDPADPRAPEVLIPFVAAYVDDVRLPERCIRVDWSRDD